MRKVWIVFTLVIILFSTGCQQTEEDGASIKALEKGSKDPQKKVVLVMIDSMTSKIIDRTREKGTIPSLNFLIENGQYYKELVAPFPTMSVVIESSLLTGEMPDKHGIPGLNWYNFAENRYIDYGTSIEKMIKLDPDQSIEDSLYHLNNIHLNKHTPTIFEELNKIGYSTGAVNFIIYRGPKSHSVSVPSLFEEALDLPEEIQTKGPDILSFGQLVEPKAVQELQLPDSVFHKLGLMMPIQ
ncbi:MAG: alkaline phosphatase family protein [Bacillaceae bacterium]|nr:alkaline phosphatase family protein [Bacillaceae bacterium]